MGVTAGIVAAVAAAASAGVGIYEATRTPKMPEAPEDTSALQAQAAATAQATALARRRGMASTIMTSPMGAPAQPTVGRATLGA